MRGYTLIEVLVVLGITALIAISGMLILVQFRSSQEIDIARKEIIAEFRDAQARSISEEEGSAWGVRFENSAVNSYILFKGSVFGAPVVTKSLPPSVVFVDPPLGAQKDIIFNTASGYPKSGIDDTIIIGLSTDNTVTKMISVYANGRIE